MKKLWIFLFGAAGYCFTEVIWRGSTHWSMALAGGTVLLLLYFLSERVGILLFPFLSAAVITAVELLFGLLFNVLLGMKVWDYTALPYSFMGQICLPYTLLWFAFGFPIFYICKALKYVCF